MYSMCCTHSTAGRRSEGGPWPEDSLCAALPTSVVHYDVPCHRKLQSQSPMFGGEIKPTWHTMSLGHYATVSCFLLHGHGQDITGSVKNAIEEIQPPHHQVFSDIGLHVNDNIRKINYAGWGSCTFHSNFLQRGMFKDDL